MHSNTNTPLARHSDGASRPLEFGILSFVIYLGFGHWDLGFLAQAH